MIVACLLLAVPVYSGNKSAKDEAARAQALTLFQKALAVSDIRAPGSPPFELQGTVNVHGGDKKDESGTYDLKWASPEQWREEIRFGDYSRVRVGGKDEYFQSRSIPYEVPSIFNLSTSLNYLRELHAWARPDSIASLSNVNIRQRTIGGKSADCAALIIRKQVNSGPEYCFDTEKGWLLSAGDWARFGRENAEYSDFISFGTSAVPSKVRANEGETAQIQFNLTSLTHLGATNGIDLERGEDATEWPSCEEPDHLTQLTRMTIPRYPLQAVHSRSQGTVVAYAIVGSDGRLHDVKVLDDPGNGFSTAALFAWSHWEYTPESCYGRPVPTETIVQAVFTVGD